MKTYYKYRGKLVDLESHFNCVTYITTNKYVVVLCRRIFDGRNGKKYIPRNKVVFEEDVESFYRIKNKWELI